MNDKVVLDGDAVAALARILTESGLTEIEYKQGETHIRVAKQMTQSGVAQYVSASPFVLPNSESHNVEQHTAPSANLTATDIVVKSPIVGTLYRASDPTSPPFVQKGSVVKEGDILFIVEAMKVMNPIRAPRNGTVAEIFAENASPVEFDQVLLSLTP